jgi:hypothetical protein
MKDKIKKEKGKISWKGLYFLGLVIVLYLMILCFNSKNAKNAIKASGDYQSRTHLCLVSSLEGTPKTGGETGFGCGFPLQQGNKNPSFASDDLLLWDSFCRYITCFHSHRFSYRGKDY